MASTVPPPSPAGHDWTTEAADRIEAVVAAVRQKTITPIQKISRIVVYGLVAGLVGLTAVVLLTIGLLRLHVYLPFHPEGRRVWITYVAIGAIFLAAGGFLWRKRTPQPRGQQ